MPSTKPDGISTIYRDGVVSSSFMAHPEIVQMSKKLNAATLRAEPK